LKNFRLFTTRERYKKIFSCQICGGSFFIDGGQSLL